MHSLRLAFGLFLVGVLASGCQGTALHRIDDKALADLPLQDKTRIVLADDARERAMEAVHATELEVEAARRDVSVAEAEVHRIQAGVSKAKAELDYAFARHDQARTDSARSQLDLEREGLQVAEAHLALARQRLAYVEHKVEVAKAEHRWADAKYELERAKLAAQRGRITIKDLPVNAYSDQEDRAHRDLINARIGSATHQQDLDKAQRALEDLERTYKGHRETEER